MITLILNYEKMDVQRFHEIGYSAILLSFDGTVRFPLVLTFRSCPRERKQEKECVFVIHGITLLLSLSLSPLIFQTFHIHFISVH